jgi:transposase, IS5 family
MFKILILQQWYGLSDLAIERQMADRISFMAFLGFPGRFPDSRTIWLFKERMAETGTDNIVWAEFQRQLDSMGLQVKRGTVLDATFIEADPGSSKKPRGDGAKTRRSREMVPGQRTGKKPILAISCIFGVKAKGIDLP